MFVVKEFKSKRLYDNEIEKVIGIGYKNKNGNVFPSPLSKFIKSNYRDKGNSLNSQRNAAYTITAFLNFLIYKVRDGNYSSLKDFGLKALTLQMAADYITLLSMKNRAGELSKNYIENKMIYLNNFYVWLSKQNILIEKINIVSFSKSYNGFSKERINLFETNDLDIILPVKSTYKHLHLKDFGENRIELVFKFLEVAQRVEPILVLGIALQIFAGLRRAEVVNLMEYNFKWANNLVITVKEHVDILFADLSNTADVKVKTPGDQICLFTEIIKPYYNAHLNLLKTAKVRKHKGLFINLKTGNAITGKSYSNKFDKVKEKFLEELLLESKIKDYYLLTNNNWSSHIGRGIYTNLLYSLDLTPTQVALLRRDKNIHSAEAYQDIFLLTLNMNLAINNFDIIQQFKKFGGLYE